MRDVAAPELAAIADADARENYRHLLSLRDGVQAAGSLQAWVIAQFSHGVTVPPLFIDLALQAIVAGMLDEPPDALQARAAELFFRTQRLSFEQGRVLAADLETLEEVRQSQGLGELGRLMAQAELKALPAQLPVLGADTESRYWRDATSPHFRSSLLLDLTQEVSTDVGHGVHFKLGNARSGLKPLAVLLERWVRQLLGAEVRITPVPRIDDTRWRWHVGLDVEATALLNDLCGHRSRRRATGAHRRPLPPAVRQRCGDACRCGRRADLHGADGQPAGPVANEAPEPAAESAVGCALIGTYPALIGVQLGLSARHPRQVVKQDVDYRVFVSLHVAQRRPATSN